MSRIGKKPVKVPSGVKVQLDGQKVTISGSIGTLEFDVHNNINVDYDTETSMFTVTRPDDHKLNRALHGTTRALIANMIDGVSKGFSKALEMYGTGYGIKQQGQDIYLTVGFAKPAVLKIPQGVSVEIETPNARGNDTPAKFKITGADKQAVGQLAAKCRKVRPPEPYLGKGIRYGGEVIRRKSGKAFGSG
ncbi:MAG: 50S ribosomal protein L6 [Phycisphaerae bacterium]|nr:50S ribosomal protein L6 [Phycisphaerae bacterium]